MKGGNVRAKEQVEIHCVVRYLGSSYSAICTLVGCEFVDSFCAFGLSSIKMTVVGVDTDR